MLLNFLGFTVILGVVLLLGLEVYYHNPRSFERRLFTSMTLTASIWLICNFFAYELAFSSPALAMVFLRLDFATAPWVFYCIFAFCHHFLSGKRLSVFEHVVRLIPILFLVGLVYSDAIISDVVVVDGKPKYGTGIWWGFYSGYLVTVFFASVGTLVRKYERFVGTKRRRVLYLLVGLSVSTSIALVINLVLEPLIRLPSWAYRLGIYGVLIFVVMSAMAMGVVGRTTRRGKRKAQGAIGQSGSFQ